MKKHICVLLMLLLSVTVGNAQPKAARLHSKVDERFELTSIVFALAGVPEFCYCRIPSYNADITNELAVHYQYTEPIDYIRTLHQQHLISYDAVSTTAEMLEIRSGKIRLQKEYDISKIADYDSRWSEELFAKYIKMLNIFYKQSNFHKFFESHRELYNTATESMDVVLAGINTEWFESFFGRPFDPRIAVYVSMVNGTNNYAMRNGVLIGASSQDGMPSFNSHSSVYSLMHELCHHYSNPIFDKWWPQMKEAAEKIYPDVDQYMRQIGYSGAYSTFGEWLNNLFTIMYYRENDSQRVVLNTTNNIFRGFFWMDRSVSFLENFYTDRGRYPYIEDFMPQLIAFINYTADNFDIVVKEIKSRQPYITNVYPAVGSDITGFDEIVITFSEPMFVYAKGFNGSGSDDKNVKCLYLEKAVWSEDGMKMTLQLDTAEAEKNCVYSIQLVPSYFLSARYYSLLDKHKILVFNTIQK